MSCWQTLQEYGLRSLGLGERLLPKQDITICEQATLIGSGMIWNVYFTVAALLVGFFLACALAVGKNSPNPWLHRPCDGFILLFRGSPLFIQFFFGYFAFMALKKAGLVTWLTSAQTGALVVLICNTAAYSAEVFYGALRALPKGEMEAADAYGFSGIKKFRSIVWPTMLRLAWPAYTNEAIFLAHATVLIYMSGFPAWQQRGDALYYANYFADKTFNPFVPYPIMAVYFIIFTLMIIAAFGGVNRRLNRHLPAAQKNKIKVRLNLIR
jgi:polar amino acid transport system permease protein